ncbi:MAG: hypothetical protein Q8R02_20120 [Hyphomonadaceae bacterium]|nr:hypothetical protein [Hyphomonadaceae bacterium]
MKDWKKLTALAVSAFALTGVASAQQAQSPPPTAASAGDQAVRTFDTAFFARFNPITAEDMVRQLPGFTIDEGEELRGFGATAGNVLIDGQRPASKTEISKELGRIAARDVLRIELIGAAAAGDIDVRGYTELANVVLKPAAQVQVSTTWAATTRYYEQGHQGLQVGATRAWKGSDFGFRLNVQGTNIGEREEVEATFRNAAGTLTRTQEEFYQQQAGELLVSGTGNWTPTARDTFNVNFRVLPRWFTLNAAADVRAPSGTSVGGISFNYTEKDIWYVDLGGDWEHKFSAANAVKLITVNRLVNWRPQQTLTQNVLGLPQGRAVDNADNRAGEHVLRGVWTLKPNSAHTVELGLEGAYNYRRTDRQSLLGALTGPLFPVTVPVASTEVEEERAEASIVDVWRINPQLTLESGFNYEASTIRQTITQPAQPDIERDFTYAKPRVVATWTPSATDQVRLSLVRDVSQLDFGDFATGLDSISSTANVGNTNLEPEQTWKLSAQWKRQIGQRGSISITGFYDDIEDTQDFISPAPTPLRTAIGNIGDGERWGGRIEATLPLDSMGVKNGLLKLNAGGQGSKVIDPLTGEEREISNEAEYDWAVDFRQDIPSMKVAWGGRVASTLPVSAGAAIVAPPATQYRVDRIESADLGEPGVDLFVETTRFLGGVLVRLTAANLLDVEKEVDRRFYTPSRIPPGAFSSTEERNSTYGRTVTLTIAGAF